MTSLLDNIDASTTARDSETPVENKPESTGFIATINRTRKEHPVLFYTLIIAVITVIVIAIILIIKRCKDDKPEKQNKQEESDQTETFYSTDNFSDEYDYINRYLNASMGNTSDPYSGITLTAHKAE